MNTQRPIGTAIFLILAAGIVGCGTKPPPQAPSIETGAPTNGAPPVSIMTNPPTTRDPNKAGQGVPDLLEQVSQQLLTVMPRLPEYVKTPTFTLVNDNQINAYATADIQGKGPGTTIHPKIVVYSGLMNRVIKAADDAEGAQDRLAFIVSHELGHVLLAHVVRRAPGDTAFVQQAFTREQESQADLKGMEMALKAGFSFRKGRGAIARMKELGLNYSSFEGIGVDHPSWNDRLILLDKDQPQLWKAMSAFQNGAFFLLLEQYAAAERCFEQVTKEFPECYEAWNNLGYALLMQYCDGLETADLRQFKIGQVVVGGFYNRPKSLEALVRGQDEKLWKAAAQALEQAAKLKPELALPKANLGVAYLVAPQGKDVPKARERFKQALELLTNDKDVPPLARAGIWINAGVADLAADQHQEAAAKFGKAAEVGRVFAGELPRVPATFTLFISLSYNRALLGSASPDAATKRAAKADFERYLTNVSPGSAWWLLAYEQYSKLCKELEVQPKEKRQLIGPTQSMLRLVASVKVKPEVAISLSELITDVVARLGEGRKIPIVRGTKLVRLCYPEQGVELIAADRVLAIRLLGGKAPELAVQGIGLGGATQKLWVGMSQQELGKILKDQPCEQRQLDRADLEYDFYPQIGLGVRLREDKVEEFVVAQIPRQAHGNE